jgi:hypothetical protein
MFLPSSVFLFVKKVIPSLLILFIGFGGHDHSGLRDFWQEHFRVSFPG